MLFTFLHSSFFIIHSSFFLLHSSFFILHFSFFILHSSFFILHFSFFIFHFLESRIDILLRRSIGWDFAKWFTRFKGCIQFSGKLLVELRTFRFPCYHFIADTVGISYFCQLLSHFTQSHSLSTTISGS